MSNEKIPDIWWKWLIATSIFLMIFGVLMMFFNGTLLEPIARESYNGFFADAPLTAFQKENSPTRTGSSGSWEQLPSDGLFF